jgi:hypothetical protein
MCLGNGPAAATILFDRLPAPAFFGRLTEDLGAASEGRVDLVVLNAAPPLLVREVIVRVALLRVATAPEQ